MENRVAMRAIILAAGRGSRLAPSLGDAPKCLLPLGGVSLLERQIHQVRGAGIDEVAVVVGCEADRVRRRVGAAVHYVENTRFAQTNSLYSLWLARPLLLDGFVVLNCDVLFHAQILSDLMTARCEDGAVVAYRGGGEAMGPEEMKVRVRRGCVVEFSKEMLPDDADGENVGLLRFGRSGARCLVEHLDRLVADGQTRDWAPRAFSAFAAERPLHAIGTRGYPWIEIDFPADYERAKAEVLPEIERIPAPAAAENRAYDATPFEPAPVLVDA
jgi:choline kinase